MYSTGDVLQKRLKQYGLGGLYSLLSEQVIHDLGSWPGPCTITADPAALEQIRIVLYSTLHDLKLKDSFSVKLINGKLVLDRKHVARTISFPQPSLGNPNKKTAEDYINILTEHHEPASPDAVKNETEGETP